VPMGKSRVRDKQTTEGGRHDMREAKEDKRDKETQHRHRENENKP